MCIQSSCVTSGLKANREYEMALPPQTTGRPGYWGPCLHHSHHNLFTRSAIVLRAAHRKATSVDLEEPLSKETLIEAASSAGAEFKYTLIALRSNASNPARRKAKALSGRTGAPGARIPRSQATSTAKYRTFESLQGYALPLMMLGEVEEPDSKPATPCKHAGGHQGAGNELPRPDSALPNPVNSASTQQKHTRRTHRRAAQASNQGDTQQPSSATPASSSPPSSVLHPGPQHNHHCLSALPTPAQTAKHSVHKGVVPTINPLPAVFVPPQPTASAPQPALDSTPTHRCAEDDSEGLATANPTAAMRRRVHKHLKACAAALQAHPRELAAYPDLQATLLRIPDPDDVRIRITHLMHVLNTPRPQAILPCIQQHPQLLLTSPEHLQQRAEEVGQLLFQQSTVTGAVRAALSAAPALLTIKHVPQDAMLGLARALWLFIDGRMEQVVTLVRRHPGLLSHPQAPQGTVFSTALTGIAEHLGCKEERVVQGCVAQLPQLLLRSPGAVAGCCRQLTAQWQLEEDQLVELVEAQPRLLLMSPGTAEVTSERIKALLLHSRHWAPDVPKLKEKPRALARLLTFNTARYDRLDYLVTTLRDGGLDWRDALTMADDDWHDMYPAYREWWAKRGR